MPRTWPRRPSRCRARRCATPASTDFAAGSAVSDLRRGERRRRSDPRAVGRQRVLAAPSMSPGWTAVPWDTGGFASVGQRRASSSTARASAPASTTAAAASGARRRCTAGTPSRLRRDLQRRRVPARRPRQYLDRRAVGDLQHRHRRHAVRPLALDAGLVANDEITERLDLSRRSRTATRSTGRPTHVDYYIDGALVKSHGFAVDGPMRPIAASDFSVFGGNIVVDWMRMSPYAATGTFESRVFDAGAVGRLAAASSGRRRRRPGRASAISVRAGDTRGAGRRLDGLAADRRAGPADPELALHPVPGGADDVRRPTSRRRSTTSSSAPVTRRSRSTTRSSCRRTA